MTMLSLSSVAVNVKHISLAEDHRPLGWNRAESYTTKINRLIRFGLILSSVLRSNSVDPFRLNSWF